jgi:hypothetical protein
MLYFPCFIYTRFVTIKCLITIEEIFVLEIHNILYSLYENIILIGRFRALHFVHVVSYSCHATQPTSAKTLAVPLYLLHCIAPCQEGSSTVAVH